MARLPDGSWLVGFERHHRLWRYRDACVDARSVRRPRRHRPPAGQWRHRSPHRAGRRPHHRDQRGIQPAARHAGRLDRPAGQDGRYEWRAFEYTKTPDFNPTAIAQLPDGSFATIERAFDMVRGVRCRVMRFEAAQLKPGGIVTPRSWRWLASPYAVDNLEGLAVTKGCTRRDAAVADLGRQFQSAPAQHPAAVRVGKVKAAYAAFFASFLALAEVTRRFSTFISGLSLLSLVPSR